MERELNERQARYRHPEVASMPCAARFRLERRGSQRVTAQSL
jgi:hypothetical protein